jgi:hypothetical protein
MTGAFMKIGAVQAYGCSLHISKESGDYGRVKLEQFGNTDPSNAESVCFLDPEQADLLSAMLKHASKGKKGVY